MYMYYVSFEIETPVDIDSISSYRDKMLNVRTMFIDKKYTASKNGSWFFKIYDDISCGAEFVTLPIELGDNLNNADVDNVADIVYSIMREIKRREGLRKSMIRSAFAKISTHITFTNHKKRNSPMPHKLYNVAIGNVIAYYFPILFYTAKYINFPYTRSSYFRRYYYSRDAYEEEKANYPAVFVPSYNYNGLPKYHKIEFRIPDSLFLAKKKNIASLLDMYIKLMTYNIGIPSSELEMYQKINRIVERALGMKNRVYNIVTDTINSEMDKIVLDNFIASFEEKFNLG